MHTVIASRQTVGMVQVDRPQPEGTPAVASGEDFAALLPDEDDEAAASEGAPASEAAAPAGSVAAAVWPAMPLIAGRIGAWGAMAGQLQSEGVQAPLSAAGSTPEQVARQSPAVLLPPDAGFLVMGAAIAPSAAQILTVGNLPNQTIELRSAGLPATALSDERALPGGTEVAANRALAASDLAISRPDGVAGRPSVSGNLQPGVAGASAGLRFWSEVPPQNDGSGNGEDGLGSAPATTRLEGKQQFLSLPGMLATATAPVAVAKLAETVLQSLFVAQADAAFLDESEGAFGFAPVGTPSSFLSLSSVSAPVAVPQLAEQLVHTIARHAEGTTEIALSPDELGQLRLTLQPDPLNPDRLVVLLSFERPETLDLFRRHADQLAEALRNAGFANVDIGFGHSGHGGNSHPRHEGAFADQPPTPEPPPVWSPGLTTAQATLRLAGSSTLDLRL